MTNWTVGMKVMFGRRNGEKTLGEIVKVNPKKLKVKQLESRGVYKSHPIGSVWGVPKSLCTPVNDMTVGEKGVGKSFTPSGVWSATPKRTDAEIIAEIQGIECGLSPENLSCDGEASRAHIRRTYNRLMARKKACIKELGREPTFDELWG
jgi:hypothetical protein